MISVSSIISLIFGAFLGVFFYSRITSIKISAVVSEIRSKIIKEQDLTLLFSILGILLCCGIFGVSFGLFLGQDILFLEKIVVGSIYFLFFIGLLYIYIFDLLYFEIPKEISIKLVFFSVLAHVCFGGMSYLIYRLSGGILFVALPFGSIWYLFAGIISAVIVFLIAFALKEKKISIADVQLFAAIGFLLGIQKTIIFALLLLLSASIVAGAYILQKRAYNNFYVPLAPFIFFSFAITIGYGGALFDMLFTVS